MEVALEDNEQPVASGYQELFLAEMMLGLGTCNI